MKTLGGWLAVVVVAALALVPAAAETELVLDGGTQLEPSSTLEFRFDEPQVEPDLLGVALPDGPVTLDPPLDGTFTWLSTRSGVFVPAAEPTMGTTYVVTAPGLRTDLTTPEFGLVKIDKGFRNAEAVPPRVAVELSFNRAVVADGADAHFTFTNQAGREIRATARHATHLDGYYGRDLVIAWEESWREALEPAAGAADDRDREAPIPNLLIVEPAEPLTPGAGAWVLEMVPGIKAATGGYSVDEPETVELGTVRPFALQEAITENVIGGGTSATLVFSDAMGPDVTDESASGFVRVEPPVPDLRFDENWRSLVLRGSFDRETVYRVSLDPSLASASGLLISGELEWEIGFEPVKPRLYLPEITGHQIMGGRRIFPALSVNLAALRVVAQKVAPGDAAAAVAAFADYELEWNKKKDGEEYQGLPEGTIEGEVIYDSRLVVPDPAVDVGQETALDWSQILGDREPGIVFLTLTGEPLPGVAAPGAPAPAAQALVQVTDLGVLWKKVSGELRASVFSMATGAAVGGAEVALLDAEFGATAEATTGAEGTAVLPPGGEETSWLVVRKGADTHALKMGPRAKTLPTGAFRLPIYYSAWDDEESPGSRMRGIVFTDRPLYKPGETVHLKGILRSVEDGGGTRAHSWPEGDGNPATARRPGQDDHRGGDRGGGILRRRVRARFRDGRRLLGPLPARGRGGRRVLAAELRDRIPGGGLPAERLRGRSRRARPHRPGRAAGRRGHRAVFFRIAHRGSQSALDTQLRPDILRAGWLRGILIRGRRAPRGEGADLARPRI